MLPDAQTLFFSLPHHVSCNNDRTGGSRIQIILLPSRPSRWAEHPAAWERGSTCTPITENTAKHPHNYLRFKHP
ncbi:hypothetical protein VTN02DRAFT_48 [Thermoascus thermophilus]